MNNDGTERLIHIIDDYANRKNADFAHVKLIMIDAIFIARYCEDYYKFSVIIGRAIRKFAEWHPDVFKYAKEYSTDSNYKLRQLGANLQSAMMSSNFELYEKHLNL